MLLNFVSGSKVQDAMLYSQWFQVQVHVMCVCVFVISWNIILDIWELDCPMWVKRVVWWGPRKSWNEVDMWKTRCKAKHAIGWRRSILNENLRSNVCRGRDCRVSMHSQNSQGQWPIGYWAISKASRLEEVVRAFGYWEGVISCYNQRNIEREK